MRLLFLSALLIRAFAVTALPTTNGTDPWPSTPPEDFFSESSIVEHVTWKTRGDEEKPVLNLPYGSFEATGKRDGL